jgi:D-sedoheptulose 7-phosphate isomerase
MIDEDVASFVTRYLQRLAGVVEAVDVRLLAQVCRLLAHTIAAGRRVCVVGNGGSSAIARSVSFQIRCHAEEHGHGPVVLDLGDQHEIAGRADRIGYASALSDMVWRRGLSFGDTVIAISMSGRSPNIVGLARDCGRHGVRAVAFTGAQGGELAELTAWCVRTGVDDQQLSEDAVLVWLTLAVDATMAQRCGTRDLRVAARRSAEHLRRLAEHPRLPGFLGDLSTVVARAMLARQPVYVVCGQGGPLGWVAEHLAHNLYWDVPTGTAAGTPMVIGPASVADLTAIHNDHPDPAHGVRYRLAAADAGDVVCGIADAGGTADVRGLLAGAASRGAATYLITDQELHRLETPSVLDVDAVDVWQLSSVVQPVAHMLCRLAGQRLRDAARDERGSSLSELLAADLAPRRVHHAPAAVA